MRNQGEEARLEGVCDDDVKELLKVLSVMTKKKKNIAELGSVKCSLIIISHIILRYTTNCNNRQPNVHAHNGLVNCFGAQEMQW